MKKLYLFLVCSLCMLSANKVFCQSLLDELLVFLSDYEKHANLKSYANNTIDDAYLQKYKSFFYNDQASVYNDLTPYKINANTLTLKNYLDTLMDAYTNKKLEIKLYNLQGINNNINNSDKNDYSIIKCSLIKKTDGFYKIREIHKSLDTLEYSVIYYIQENKNVFKISEINKKGNKLPLRTSITKQQPKEDKATLSSGSNYKRKQMELTVFSASPSGNFKLLGPNYFIYQKYFSLGGILGVKTVTPQMIYLDIPFLLNIPYSFNQKISGTIYGGFMPSIVLTNPIDSVGKKKYKPWQLSAIGGLKLIYNVTEKWGVHVYDEIKFEQTSILIKNKEENTYFNFFGFGLSWNWLSIKKQTPEKESDLTHSTKSYEIKKSITEGELEIFSTSNVPEISELKKMLSLPEISENEPVYNFNFIDISDNKYNRLKLLNCLDSLKKSYKNEYLMYITNGKSSLSAKDNTEYEKMKNQIGELNTDISDTEEDLQQILSVLKDTKFSTYKNTTISFFVSDIFYKKRLNEFVKRLEARTNQKFTEINIYLIKKPVSTSLSEYKYEFKDYFYSNQ